MLDRPHLTRPLFSYVADFLASWEHYRCCEVQKTIENTAPYTSLYVSVKYFQIISLK